MSKTVLRIGFDGSRAFNQAKTGTENYSYHLLVNLAKIDHVNRYIVYLRPGSNHRTFKWPENFQFEIINFPRLWTQVGLALQTFKDNLDLLFIPAHAAPLIHIKGLKTVITVHDLGAEYLPKAHQLKQRLYLKLITKFQLKNASKLIAVSTATKIDLVKKIGINPHKISIVHEGYNEKLFKPAKSDTQASSLMPYFIFVGTVQPRKNLERIIKAFALYLRGEIKLVIVGSKGWLSDEIYKLPKKLGIEDSVKFLGYVSDGDLPKLYSQAQALVFPSLFEGFGLPILEAQACGCPVLTSKISSMPEVGGKGVVYVDPYSVDDIIRGMKEVSKNREKVVKAGFGNIKRFSWEKCARETLKVLESL